MKDIKPETPNQPMSQKTLDLRTKHSSRTTHAGLKKSPSIEPTKPKKHPNRWKKVLAVLFSLILIGGGLYILFILLTPVINKPSDKSVREQAEIVTERDHIFIPSVGIQSEIKSGGIDILDQGVVWHRFPERGNPEKGGNFILTGHSFVWGYTPQEVTKQSVFYHLGDAKQGDEVIIHYKGKKYNYEIKEKTTVKPNAVEIEKTSDKPKMTVYTCTTGGSSDGRVVLVAEPKE